MNTVPLKENSLVSRSLWDFNDFTDCSCPDRALSVAYLEARSNLGFYLDHFFWITSSALSNDTEKAHTRPPSKHSANRFGNKDRLCQGDPQTQKPRAGLGLRRFLSVSPDWPFTETGLGFQKLRSAGASV